MFNDTKYTRWYYLIIENARKRQVEGYIEKHHIIPRALGGDDSSENIVKLTAREHYVCHLLLTKMVSGYFLQKMNFALGRFVQNGQGQNRLLSSRQYDIVRKAISKARTGVKHSDETRKKMSENRKTTVPWNKGVTGIVHSEESNKKRSLTLKGKSFEERVGEEKAAEMKKKISAAKLGHKSGMTGRTHSAETKARMREAALARNKNKGTP